MIFGVGEAAGIGRLEVRHRERRLGHGIELAAAGHRPNPVDRAVAQQGQCSHGPRPSRLVGLVPAGAAQGTAVLAVLLAGGSFQLARPGC